MHTDADHRHMTRALELAARGRFTTRPNPQVGCVIVNQGHVVGEGWHERAGEPHAEVHALKRAAAAARGATAYVTLEPCAHHGRTPPCYQALLQAGIERVVVACEDPFHKVAGRGIAFLREAGIAVDVGVMRREAQELNKGFLSSARRGRPWVTLKMAMSLDGRTALADGRSKWITGAAARTDVHRLRREHCAILTGSATVLADDPSLTVRLDEDRAFVTPWRVVLDSDLRLPHTAQVFDEQAPTLLVHRVASGHDQLPEGVQAIQVEPSHGHVSLHSCLQTLSERGLHRVLVEAGATLAGALVREGLVDELVTYVSPRLLGSDARPLLLGAFPTALDAPAAFELTDVQALGDDVRICLRNTQSAPACFIP